MGRIILQNAIIVTGASSMKGALAIDGQKIAGIWHDDTAGPEGTAGAAAEAFPDAETIDLGGLTVMAGAIDAHVHFREPGMTHKGDMASESAAALLGGVTSYIDMPNTNPPTVSENALEEKLRLAAGRSFANYGFHIGATNSNCEAIEGMCAGERRFAGVKVFMGSSTGNMLVDNGSALERLFSLKGMEVLVHSEDEATIRRNLEEAKAEYGENVPFAMHPEIRSRQACVRSSIRALEMALKHGTRLHLCHVTTKEEVEMIRAAKLHNPGITAETSANYLWFSSSDYETLGAKIKCNPAIKDAEDRAALRQALKDGVIDTIGSDHAPHLPEEKAKPYPTCPSGVPSVQHSLEAVLTVAAQEEIPLERVTEAMSEKTAEMFGIRDRGRIAEGYYADLVVVDPSEEHMATAGAYKCGWSPYEGAKMKGAVKMVFLNGTLAARDGKLLSPALGTALEYE